MKTEIIQVKKTLANLTQEYANYRQRTTKEKEELRQTGCKRLLQAILPALDDFERTLANCNQDQEAFKKGVFLSYINLVKGLQSQGVEIMETKQITFNPEFHEAIGVSQAGKSGEISKCIRHGYLLNGEVVRHAQVIVSQ